MAEVEIINRRPLNSYTLLTSPSSMSTNNGPITGPLMSRTSTSSALQSQKPKAIQSTRSCPNTSLLSRSPVVPVESYLSQINEIEDGLYLSGARALTPNAIYDLGISCVINVTVELPNVPYAVTSKCDSQVETIKIPIDDSPYANIAYYFERTTDKIDETLRKRQRILVHCVAGVSRSATIILAFLMKYRQMSLRRAFEHVKSRRPIIRPNPGFFRQLIDYESRLFGKTTVKMSWNAAAGGNIPDLYEHEYLNTMNFINKYGCYHNHSRGDDNGFTSRTWPGTAANIFSSAAATVTSRCCR